MKYNDLNLKNWKEIDLNTDSLWIIKERDKSGKHKNIYHGNFIPQIPNELIRRYTQEGDTILEPFMGSGTTLFECEKLNRKYIGFDINQNMIDYVNSAMNSLIEYPYYYIENCNSQDTKLIKKALKEASKKIEIEEKVQFVMMHPPYLDIVKFTDNKNDLSQESDINEFLKKLKKICKNFLTYLEKDRYFAIVIGDIYRNSEVIPLGFYCMDMIQKSFNVKLKGTIVKNIEGNRGKLGSGGIWRYRALNSDYYIFKHEYIFVFKKEF
ncbi:DNA adenine methylase [Arcobacter sp. CECT 8986]|uniref:DNA methyltransferase n=1 Tax=Arcobacter sp. CECT 8986 TaxID=2044507 RepID=UPI001009D7C4|nr:DNA methyltransferase [Arcobacter sp. CECT 8986]RXJ98094.1 DNA adenine methylase [Arcobacter sp. CECT 8986]